MTTPYNPYPGSNPQPTPPQPGFSPIIYPGQDGNGFTGQYPPYPQGTFPGGMPQQGTDLSWLLNSVKRNRIWFIPIAMLPILVGYIIIYVSSFSSYGATGTSWLFLALGHAVLVAFILSASKQVGKFTKAASWIASVVISGGWLFVMLNEVFNNIYGGYVYGVTLLVFTVLIVIVMISGIITGTVLSHKTAEPVSPAAILLVCLFLLLVATTTPTIHAVGMLLLLGAVACAVIKPRPAYFVSLGLSAILSLTNFIFGLSSPATSTFLGRNYENQANTLYGILFDFQFRNVGWIYWIIGGLSWAFSLVVLAGTALAIYQTIARKPLTDLTEVFKTQINPYQYPSYYQQGQYPAPYGQQPYYGQQLPPQSPYGQQPGSFQPPQQFQSPNQPQSSGQSFTPPFPPQPPAGN